MTQANSPYQFFGDWGGMQADRYPLQKGKGILHRFSEGSILKVSRDAEKHHTFNRKIPNWNT